MSSTNVKYERAELISCFICQVQSLSFKILHNVLNISNNLLATFPCFVVSIVFNLSS